VCTRGRIVGQKHQARAVRAGLGQLEAQYFSEEAIRRLDQDAGAVAGVRIGPAGAAMFEIDEEIERRPDYRVRTVAFDVRDKADAARIVLVARAVQAPGPLVTDTIHALIREPGQP